MSHNFSFLPHDIFSRANEIFIYIFHFIQYFVYNNLPFIIYGMINEPGQKHLQVCKNI